MMLAPLFTQGIHRWSEAAQFRDTDVPSFPITPTGGYLTYPRDT